MRIAITGTHGFVGESLVRRLTNAGHTVLPVVREPAHPPGTLYWDGISAVEAEGFRHLDAVIHLAGENLFGPWTPAKKRRIRDSRVRGTRALAQALANLPPQDRPCRFLCASAVGIYGDRGEETLWETSGPGKGFLAGVCREWEEATGDLPRAGISVAQLRFGIILGRSGGILKRLSPFASFGLMGTIGAGSQYVSWVSLEDIGRVVEFLLERNVEGPVNVVSPRAATQAAFVENLARVSGQGARLWVPEKVVRWIGGTMAEEMLLASCRAYPRRLLKEDFRFLHEDLGETLQSLFARAPAAEARVPLSRTG